MPVRIADPRDAIRDRAREMETADPNRPSSAMDARELTEREQAAQAYAGENERHFVDYCHECVRESIQAQDDIRKMQAMCWKVYNEEEPDAYKLKEFWQSRTVIPKPFQTVQFAAAAVKKAFSPNFLSVTGPKSSTSHQFWEKILQHYMSLDCAKFVPRFGDATIMAYAVGMSMEMIPRWVPGKGLEFSLAEPWKIHRDPDALSRNPQSGTYWVHEEWLDYFVLQQGERNGRYFDVARAKNMAEGDGNQDAFMTKEAIAERKQMIWQRSKYRTLIKTRELWGLVLSPAGEVLLPSATYTVAGGRVIQKPQAVDTGRRWPGTGFTALPNLLRFGGRGLLEGVLTLWDALNEILNLHLDALKWAVNPPKEINVDGLVDPTDTEDIPGKKWLVHDTMNGQHVVRFVEGRSRTNDVLANQQFLDQNYQRGAFVTDAVQGLPGYRKDITFREAAMNLDQAMGVFGLMGESLEEGAVDIIHGAIDTIENNIGYADLEKIFTREELNGYGIKPNPEASRGVTGIPAFEGKCHVSGMQALMRDNETMKTIRELIIPLSERPGYAPYIKKYQVIKAIEVRAKLTDEKMIADDNEAKVIDLQERLASAKEGQAAEALARLQEALGITELIEKLQHIDAEDIRQAAEEIRMMEAMNGRIGSPDQPGDVAPQRNGATGAAIPAGVQ